MDCIPEHPILEFIPDTLGRIRKLYGLENGRMGQSVDLLEQWVQKQPHFLYKHFSKAYYEKTIVACKGSVEKAKIQIERLCTYKTLFPKYFICNIEETVTAVSEVACCVPLPKMTKDYHRIYMIKIYNKQFTPADMISYLRLNVMSIEYIKVHDYVEGFIIIDDFRDSNLTEVLRNINVVEFRQYVAVLVEGFGAVVKDIHVISESKLIDFFIKSAKAFLPEKIASRVHVHRDLEELYKFVDRKLLPSDMGGNEKTLQELNDEWTKELCSEEHQKYLEVMSKARTDETLRQVDKFNEQCMGLPGSFRTLTVD